MRLLKISISLLFFMNVVAGCTGQSEADCSKSLKRSQSLFSQYGFTSDRAYLLQALLPLDSSLKCKNTKTESINFKIKIYSLLEDYNGGIIFLKSLESTDFNKPFKKKMFINIFEASQLESQGDSADSKKLYSKIASEISVFIRTNPSREFDSESYGILIYLSSKYLTHGQILQKLDSLERLNRSEADFFRIQKEYYQSTSENSF